ncbi:MAG: glycosyltransferase [Deltaproteobacteria bacterium]|nr:glycosyltransferase [Deltaproteobacteria bacterium]
MEYDDVIKAKRPLRADMHVHSRYSARPSEWFLRKIGCAESYTDPLRVYETARARGMDLVTITDHNTLAGSHEIAHLEHALVGEEITTYFPEDGCKLHVLAYDIRESHHEDISRIRENVFDLVKYLQEQRIFHALAHPLYAVNDLLTERHFCLCLLLFKTFELNGARDGFQNQVLREILSSLAREDMELLADQYNQSPCGEDPWVKNLIGGSDDHSALHIGSSTTEVDGATSARDFLGGIREGRGLVSGMGASPKHLAQNLYSIAYQFYRHKLDLERYVGKDLLLRFIDRALLAAPDAEKGFMNRVRGAVYSRGRRKVFGEGSSTLKDMLLKEGREIVLRDPQMQSLLRKRNADLGGISPEGPEVWFRFVNEVSDKVLKRFADSILETLSGANVFDIFQSLGSAGSLYTLLSPYFLAYTLFTKDRRFSLQCYRHVKGHARHEKAEAMKVAHFTDTLQEINGVAFTLQMEAAVAVKHNRFLRIITCGSGKKTGPAEIHFDPVGSFALPEYPDLRLYYPPLLSMLDYCFREDFTHIHLATPGPIGLAGLAVARILKIPVYGTYHTALPQYVRTLTGDPGLEEMTWKYTIWFYNQMDVVYVPSHATGKELEARGLAREKIRFFDRGIDTERFHPSKRNGFFQKRFGMAAEDFKLLYVGRVSREKNLAFLAEGFRRLHQARRDLRLIVVGDGPYLLDLKKVLADLPVTFTGSLFGEDLAQAYASSDLFVFPSTTDTFGNVVLEAQASGLPVIVTNEGGPQENLVHGSTGLIVPANDMEAFVQTILGLINDPEAMARMRCQAREYMKDRSFESAFLTLWGSYGDAGEGFRPRT